MLTEFRGGDVKRRRFLGAAKIKVSLFLMSAWSGNAEGPVDLPIQSAAPLVTGRLVRRFRFPVLFISTGFSRIPIRRTECVAHRVVKSVVSRLRSPRPLLLIPDVRRAPRALLLWYRDPSARQISEQSPNPILCQCWPVLL